MKNSFIADYLRKLETSDPIKPGMYLHLFHGRKTPGEQVNGWGTNGPHFGPLQYCHITYCSTISLAAAGDEEGGTGPMLPGDALHFHQEYLVYGGVYYGDWTLGME